MATASETVPAAQAGRLKDAEYTPPLQQALPLGIQHVLAMFASNVTPAFIVAGAAGLAGADLVYMVQMAMLFSGIATLLQTVGVGRVGARLPIMQGTSFAFIPIMIPVVKTAGMGALFGGVVIGGLFHFLLGTFIGKLRRWLPPLVTGLVILAIGLSLIPVGIRYAAGGVPLEGTPEFGTLRHWFLALVVIFVSLGIKFYVKGFIASAAVLIGLVAGYVVAIPMGMVNFGRVAGAAWISLPNPLHFGFEVNVAAIVGMCLMSVVSAIETVGDISGITKGGADREATDKEIAGGTMADGLGTALAGFFGALPNTSFSQNVGLIAMTGVMSRHVVTLGAIFLIVAGLVPKVGAVIAAMPIAVLGGGVIVMFGMICAAGLNMLSEVKFNRRNMVILAVSLSVGLGLQSVPGAMQHLPSTMKLLLVSGLLPVAVIAVVLNMIVPEQIED
ncbi:MAG: purine permease [Inquilinus sp.]|nr:purine permease [Inquilinus sp.]